MNVQIIQQLLNSYFFLDRLNENSYESIIVFAQFVFIEWRIGKDLFRINSFNYWALKLLWKRELPTPWKYWSSCALLFRLAASFSFSCSDDSLPGRWGSHCFDWAPPSLSQPTRYRSCTWATLTNLTKRNLKKEPNKKFNNF